MENNYWNDYTIFICTVEDLTKDSPSDLIDLYTKLVEELEQGHEKDILEWVYEDSGETYTRIKIQNVLDSDKLVENILLKEFRENIDVLDRRLEVFLKLKEDKNKNWRRNFSPALIDWEKVRKAE